MTGSEKNAMTITHVNRQGKTYFLHVGTTKTGKPKYYFSLSGEGTLVEQLPEGYEIHEQASGQVSLRRERPILITDKEVQVVESARARVAAARQGYVDRDRENLTVYIAERSGNFEGLLRSLAPFASSLSIEEAMTSTLRYEAVFRFVLVDPEARLFQAQRFCYLGGIDDWIFVGSSGSLAEVARRFLVHIGKDSYYELM